MKKLIPVKLNKVDGKGNLISINNASLTDIGGGYSSTLTARYYKGIGANHDQMVMEYETDNCETRQKDRSR